jgi:hypothetical protein
MARSSPQFVARPAPLARLNRPSEAPRRASMAPGGPSPAPGEPLAESIPSCLARPDHCKVIPPGRPRSPSSVALTRMVSLLPSLIRLGRPDRAPCARPAPLARLNRHSKACCHVGPTRPAHGGPSPARGEPLAESMTVVGPGESVLSLPTR